ncbi:MAG TPA: hypothetical protein VLB80_03450 [Candidatus Babeliales bacterium]|nr:hypothetical protein [Candidatus Babeliales bacterium]
MWPIPTLNNTFVTVFFSSDTLICSWIERIDNNPLLTLRAYKRYPLSNLELERLTIFNPTIIQKYISLFLHEYDLINAFILFSLQGSGVTEKFVAMSTSTPHHSDFGSMNSRNFLWEYRYLYPNDKGQFIFYVYKVLRSLVLQYQLLAIAAGCNLVTMTTKTIGLIDAYKYIFGTAFRRSQFAIDMIKCNNNIETLFSIDMLNRMLIFTTKGALQDQIYHAASIGLLSAERAV